MLNKKLEWQIVRVVNPEVDVKPKKGMRSLTNLGINIGSDGIDITATIAWSSFIWQVEFLLTVIHMHCRILTPKKQLFWRLFRSRFIMVWFLWQFRSLKSPCGSWQDVPHPLEQHFLMPSQSLSYWHVFTQAPPSWPHQCFQRPPRCFLPPSKYK